MCPIFLKSGHLSQDFVSHFVRFYFMIDYDTCPVKAMIVSDNHDVIIIDFINNFVVCGSLKCGRCRASQMGSLSCMQPHCMLRMLHNVILVSLIYFS